MDLGFQNFSEGLHALNRFQDLYIPPHLYGPPETTTESPSHSSKFRIQKDGFRDRLWHGWNTGASDDVHRHVDGYGGGGGNSAAISALGLLAFLFFLNLIQNSLTNNRWNLLNFSANRTRTQTPLGRSRGEFLSSFDLPIILADDAGPIGKKRQRRSPAMIGQTPDSIPLDPTDQNSMDMSSPHRGHGKTMKLSDQESILPNLRKRFIRQANVTRRGIPLKCLIEFYACAISRRLNPNKLRRNSAQPIGLARKLIVLPVKDRAGNNRVVEALVPQLQKNQPPKSCRTLFGECRVVPPLPG